MAIANKITCDQAARILNNSGYNVIVDNDYDSNGFILHIGVRNHIDNESDWFELSDRQVKEWAEVYTTIVEEDLKDYKSDLDKIFEVGKIDGNMLRFGYYRQVDIDELNRVLVESVSSQYKAIEMSDYDEDRGWMYWYRVEKYLDPSILF
jgi:hypothetical protein